MSETAENRGPGRPKGLPKSGGRKPGSGNRVPAELRQYVNQRGRPLELLAAIADGRKVSVADPDEPGKKKRVYPTLHERTAAARVLLNKLLPDLRATELSGPDGEPLEMGNRSVLPNSDKELARQVAFMLARGLNEVREDAAAERHPEAQRTPAAPQSLPQPKPAPSPAPDAPEAPARPARTPGETHEVGGYTISFAETLHGDRERWAIRDGNGKPVGTAFGKDAAEVKAKLIGEDRA